ncbi:MAG TPA: monooxygenase, partial [Micromonosporaceae bacterium]|nr:monooxygenase [Micromonosporaceae bacterium]
MGLGSRWAAVAVVAALLAGIGGEPDASLDRGPDPTPAGPASQHLPHHAAPPPAAPLRAGERFVTLAMPQPYTPVPPSGGTDEYRCFLIDPELTEPVFLTGSQFLPQNADIVHHAIFFRVAPDDAAEARRVDASTPGDGWTCFGGTGIQGVDRGQSEVGTAGAWLAAWVPGSGETLLPARTGYRIEPGTQVIMQMHYSLLATDGRPAGADRSGVRLRLAPGDADLDPLHVTLLPAPVELPCAEGESGPLCDRAAAVRDVTGRFGLQSGFVITGLNLYCNGGRDPVAGPQQHCDQPVRQAGLVHAAGGHMHMLGRSVRVELNPGT